MREIHLFDLPEEIRIDLTNLCRRKLFLLTIRKVGSIKDLAILLNTKPKNIQRWKNGKRLFTIAVLKRLVSLVEMNPVIIEKNVICLKIKHGYVKNPKLPIKISKEVGIILGGMLGDGGIGSDYSVHYSNSSYKMIDTFIKSVKSVFGGAQFCKNKKDGVFSIFFTSILGKILVKNFNVPIGDKTLIDYTIPEIIVNSGKNIIKTFLQRLFDDEGYVSKSLKAIVFNTTVEKNKINGLDGPKRLIQLRELLQRFGINCGKPTKSVERNHISRGLKLSAIVQDWRLIIYNRKNLKIFAKKIGFFLSYKMRDLLNIINSIKLEISPKHTSLSYFLENALKLENNIKRPFTSVELALTSKRKISQTRSIIKKLKELGILEEVIPKKLTSKGYTPSYFILNKNKLNFQV